MFNLHVINTVEHTMVNLISTMFTKDEGFGELHNNLEAFLS